MKRSFLFFTLIIFLVVSGCSSNIGDKKNGTKKISGKIVIVGNEPFAKLAITDGSNTYFLNGDKKIIEKLKSEQGLIYELTYNLLQKDNSIKIIKAKKLKN